MRGRPAYATGLAVAALLLLVSLCSAQIPEQMNYQVMLTDDADQPLADQSVELLFRIYNVEAGGSQLWTETHDVATNSIGVASVVLGSTNPIHLLFSVPLWLQVEVEGEVMDPRRPLTAAPYARRAGEADHASEADQAVNSDHAVSSDELDGIPASAWALDDDLWQPGTLNNPANPLEWTKLKSVPAGFADGTDDVGTGVGGSGTVDYIPKFTSSASIGNSVISEDGGRVSIGSPIYDARLSVEQSGPAPALYLTNTSTLEAQSVLEISRTEPLDETYDGMLMLQFPDSSTDGGLIECMSLGSSYTTTVFSVSYDGHVGAAGGLTLSPPNRLYTIDANGNYDSDDARVIRGIYSGSGTFDAAAIYGESKPQDWYGIGGSFEGGYIGALGEVNPTGADFYFGLLGAATGGTGTNYGVHAAASSGAINYGVFGVAWGGSENWAGYFVGDVRVTGTFTNPGPVLEMDHPADPENSYLRHALVASPEMKTVYDGTVVLGAGGEVWVELPDWFEILNGNFHYQLTPIGAPAPGLYVADTVSNGRFRIAGGEPGMSVSWQVTGVRHDAHARRHPLVVEQEKEPKDRGRYISPEAHGAARETGIGHLEDKKAYE